MGGREMGPILVVVFVVVLGRVGEGELELSLSDARKLEIRIKLQSVN
jgi:hypothetical protein